MLDKNLNTPLAFHYIFTTESLLFYKLTEKQKIRMAHAHANTYNYTFKFLCLGLLFKVQPI